jgi:8-oxo-dGTP pyrophosphatase MutT (NUDIX family)
MYFPLNTLDLNKQSILNANVPLIDASHLLWQRLEKVGAELKGTQDQFPVYFSNGEIWQIEYRVRKGYTAAGACDLGAFTLLNAVKRGDGHPFWKSVGLPGVPMFWGASSIVTCKGKLLLGLKKEGKQFGGQITPPAGIVEQKDFDAGGTLEDVLIRAALRELREETNGIVTAKPEQVTKVETFVEEARCKQQAFVYVELNDLPDLPEDGIYDEFEHMGFYGFSTEGWAALRHAGGLK